MNNNVTLEQLNAPTDMEALRCGMTTYVKLMWEARDGESGEVQCHTNREWVDQRVKEMMGSGNWIADYCRRRTSRSETHEDEELMIRVKLDEGV